MPMTILEAFAHGKAVVARDRGAMSEMVVNRKNGLLYSSVNQLVQRIDELKTMDFCKELGARAYLAYADQYSEEVGYQNLMNVYNSLV
jgi:glycosyltransferase involved in cell wall biosynthesis